MRMDGWAGCRARQCSSEGGLERDFVRRLACLSSVDVGWQKQRGALPACSQHSVVLYAFPV